MELGGQQYTTWKNELIMIERYILKELGFSLYNIMDHPHKYILYFIRVLNGSEELANIAWSYLNDSMRLDISLRYEAQTIACSAIYLAARKLGVVLPEDSETGAWWEVFGANTEHMRIISAEILGLYHSEKVSVYNINRLYSYCDMYYIILMCSDRLVGATGRSGVLIPGSVQRVRSDSIRGRSYSEYRCTCCGSV